MGVTLIVQNLGRLARDRDGVRISPVGEIEAHHPVVGCGESDPGQGVSRRFFDGFLKAGFSDAIVAAIEILHADLVGLVGGKKLLAPRLLDRERGQRAEIAKHRSAAGKQKDERSSEKPSNDARGRSAAPEGCSALL